MKILYGIQLTGNGHITRSVEIIAALKRRGFDVDIITSGSNSQLSMPYEIKKSFRGLSFHYNKKGGIDWVKTIINLDAIRLLRDIKYDTKVYDIVISDFEPISAYSARRDGTKSIGIGNQYSIYCEKTPMPKKKDFFAELFIRNFAKCGKNIAIGYKKHEESMSLPVIGKALLESKASEEEFYLVYLPSMSTENITKCINEYGAGDWIVYSPESKEMSDGRITIKRPSKEDFQKDLLRCKGVITASGFSTTSEALVLKKKLWSIPIKGQYEQLCNSEILKEMGVFTEQFGKESIKKWVECYGKIDYFWENPIDDIVEKIIDYYEEN